MSDVELLQALDEKFKQYWGADNYISFDSLKVLLQSLHRQTGLDSRLNFSGARA